MDEFLKAPNDASHEAMASAFNTVIDWIQEDDDRIDIAEVVLLYMSRSEKFKNVYLNIFTMLMKIADIKKQYDEKMGWLIKCLMCDPKNDTIYIHILNTLPKISNTSLILQILPHLQKDVTYYDIIVIYMFEYLTNYTRKNHDIAHEVLKYFSCEHVRYLHQNTHQLITPYTSKDVQEDYTNFMQSLELVIQNPQPYQEFLIAKQGLIFQKLGFHLAYIPQFDIKVSKLVADVYVRLYPYCKYISPNIYKPQINSRKRVKIGFISSFLCDHTIGKMFGGVIKHIDRKRFEVHIYNICNDTHVFEAYADKYVSLRHTSIDFKTSILSWYETIAHDDLDILVYPEIGMEVLTYLMSFSRLAKTQVVWWGHPESPCTNIDFYISSQYFNDHQQQYQEQLIKMKNLSVIFQRPSIQSKYMSRSDLGLPEKGRLYMCIQTFFKYSIEFDDALYSILKNDSDSYIVIVRALDKPYYIEMLSKRWRQHLSSHDLNRIILVQRRSTLSDLLALVHHADILLDTFPFSGSTTHLECFSIGKPVVTMNGTDLRGSLCSGIYRRLGIKNAPIAKSLEEYVNLAIKYANDKELYKETEKQILDAMELFYDSQDEKDEWNDILYKLATSPDTRLIN